MRPWILALAALAALQGTRPASGPVFDRVLPLAANEGVFAYARISPDGRFLAYASEMPDPVQPRIVRTTQTVVDLTTKQRLFAEPGIDAYWSLDGERIIFLAQGGRSSVTIRHHQDGTLARDVAPVGLGDYFSWAQRDGRNLILTIQSNYYYLDGDKAVLPHARVTPCPDIGVGDRPLISKDGRRISTFVRGAVVIRGIDNCDNIIDTGLQGAKADFSFDGKYVAFHVARGVAKAYDVVVIDLEKKTMRVVTADLPGSSLFPSWTKDGRLNFRYDGDDYRGFMIADRVLDVPARPLTQTASAMPAHPKWSELFPETPQPSQRVAVVLIWAPWSAHAPQALLDLQQAAGGRQDVAVATALEIGGLRNDADRIRRENGIRLPEIPLAPSRFLSTEAVNQIPTSLLFRDGAMIDRHLGAQTADELKVWIQRALGDLTPPPPGV